MYLLLTPTTNVPGICQAIVFLVTPALSDDLRKVISSVHFCLQLGCVYLLLEY